jgi:hypothetical protein
VKRPIVDVGAHGLAIALLLVADIVLRASLDSSVLHALDGVGHCDTSQVRISRESLPVAASVGNLAESTCKWLAYL